MPLSMPASQPRADIAIRKRDPVAGITTLRRPVAISGRSRQSPQAGEQFVREDALLPIIDQHGFVEPYPVADGSKIGRREMPRDLPRHRAHRDHRKIARIHPWAVGLRHPDPDIIARVHALRGPYNHW
jgi:hypothetical protein